MLARAAVRVARSPAAAIARAPATSRRCLSAPPSMTKRYVLLYDYVADVLEKRGPHREGHIGLIRSMHKEGLVFAGGAFSDPVDGAIIVFNTKEAAEDFLAKDPYATSVVTDARIREWTTVDF